NRRLLRDGRLADESQDERYRRQERAGRRDAVCHGHLLDGGTRRCANQNQNCSKPSVRQEVPGAQSDNYLSCAQRLRHSVIEKPDPCGPGSSSSAREPTITFQRGTAAGVSVAIWEDGQPIASSDNVNMPSDMSPNNLEARMPAMRGSQAAVCSMRFTRYVLAP